MCDWRAPTRTLPRLRSAGVDQVTDDLGRRGILVRSRSTRGVAEEAPGAYKDVSAVVEVAEHAGLSRAVARLEPVICVKG
jgi:tRNA-splicing ligase RtcB (3'-phosphate/5'-hydroxy nucleic acid ligase)